MTLQEATGELSIRRTIFDSLSPKLQSRFRDYPHDASSLWQELHHLFNAPLTPIVYWAPVVFDDVISMQMLPIAF